MSDENKNPYDLVDNENQKPKETTYSISEKASNFLEDFVRKIAKKAWLPDPKTWEPANTDTAVANNTANNANRNTTLEQDIATQEWDKKQEEKKFNFENVMSWVSWVLNKIWEKVEEKVKSIDIDNIIKENNDNTTNYTEKNETIQNKENSNVWSENKENNNQTENKVEKNNEEYLSENH